VSDVRRVQLVGGPLDGAVVAATRDQPIVVERALIRSEGGRTPSAARERHVYAPRPGTNLADFCTSEPVPPDEPPELA